MSPTDGTAPNDRTDPTEPTDSTEARDPAEDPHDPPADRAGHTRHHDDPSGWLPAWHPATLVAHVWARRAIRTARRTGSTGLDDLHVAAAPSWLPDDARRGMHAALYRTQARCLVSATVRQAWERAHGTDRQLVIGVTAPSRGFRAHAWLEGDPPCCSTDFTELLRR